MTTNTDALFDDLDVVRAETEAAKLKQAAIDKIVGPGPVYQGVSKTIRALTASGTYTSREQRVDPDEFAGLIALARSTARVVDRMSGHNVTGWTANGRDLAPLVEQLREVMAALHGDTDVEDPLFAWLNDNDAPKELAE